MSDFALFVMMLGAKYPEMFFVAWLAALAAVPAVFHALSLMLPGILWIVGHAVLPVVIGYQHWYPRYQAAARDFGGILWHASFAGMSSFAAYHMTNILSPWYWDIYAWLVLSAALWATLSIAFAIARWQLLEETGDSWIATVPAFGTSVVGGLVTLGVTSDPGLAMGTWACFYVLAFVSMLCGVISARVTKRVSMTA